MRHTFIQINDNQKRWNLFWRDGKINTFTLNWYVISSFSSNVCGKKKKKNGGIMKVVHYDMICDTWYMLYNMIYNIC